MTPLPVRLQPGDDLRERLEALVQEQHVAAVLAILPGWTFARRRASATGYPELVIARED